MIFRIIYSPAKNEMAYQLVSGVQTAIEVTVELAKLFRVATMMNKDLSIIKTYRYEDELV